MQTLRAKFFRTSNVVDVVGVAAVDDDVAGVELSSEIVKRAIHHRRGHHQPHGPRLLQFVYEIIERSSGSCAVVGDLFHRLRVAVENHALMAGLLQPPRHVGSHPSQSNHS
jgi:hypothetical protein